MANSRRSSPGARKRAPGLAAVVDGQLQRLVRPGDRLLLGLSGGLDSMVLLEILSLVARRRRIRVSALHVNHQLSPNASAWERFCRRTCRDRSIPFRSVRVQVARGNSVEASARAARYAALLAQPAEFVVLAHHQDDQAETVLLQLLRGAGVQGLAAMPLNRKDEGGRRKAEGGKRSIHSSSFILHPSILRPLLEVTRAEIERYARRRKLEWVEDESNADTRYARNFLRRELLPLLGERFPACRATLARSARHLGEAAQLLDDLAAIDAADALRDGMLAVAAVRNLPPARARNLVRWFLGRSGVAMPNADRLDEILRQTITARGDAEVRVALEGCELFRWKDALHIVPGREPVERYSRVWRQEPRLDFPELGGVLHMVKGRGAGISLARLKENVVTVRTRAGGERLRPDCRRPRRTLKNLFQELQVPPWERSYVPLLYCEDRLIWVPGVGVDCAYQAGRRETSLIPNWVTSRPA
jgi:tRNA(Ile)-lysidine synthase